MNIQQLRTFVTIVDAGSFSAASRVLEISQPAVSMQIQSLEAELGATLLERRYRKVDLTEAGRALLPVATKVLGELEDVREQIDALDEQVTGHLIIAASTTPGVYVIPRVLGGFVEKYPRIRLTLLVADSAEVVRQVTEGEASIGVTGAKVRGARADFEELGIDELVAIAPAASDLKGRRLSIAEFARQPFVVREHGSGTRQMAEAVFREHAIDVGRVETVLELGTGEAVVSAVEGGLGVAVLSRLVAERALALGSVAMLDVEGFPAPRLLYTVLPRGGVSRATGAFLEYLRGSFAKW